MVIVVQLVRTPDCDSGGRGFEPHHSPPNQAFARRLFCFFVRLGKGGSGRRVNRRVAKYAEGSAEFYGRGALDKPLFLSQPGKYSLIDLLTNIFTQLFFIARLNDGLKMITPNANLINEVFLP